MMPSFYSTIKNGNIFWESSHNLIQIESNFFNNKNVGVIQCTHNIGSTHAALSVFILQRNQISEWRSVKFSTALTVSYNFTLLLLFLTLSSERARSPPRQLGVLRLANRPAHQASSSATPTGRGQSSPSASAVRNEAIIIQAEKRIHGFSAPRHRPR